jgi:release factor glutamine methyltransferase
VIGIDASPQAIEIAIENARKYNVKDRCQFVVGNLLEPLAVTLGSPNIIISNPPYIPTADIEELDPDVKDFEPRQALDGGKDGLDYIRKLIKESPNYLQENGWLVLEFGMGQAEEIKSIAKPQFRETKIIKDAAGKERFFLGQR